MKYKKGDDIYLKGQITDVSSCSEASFPYEVNTADEFIYVREKDIVSVNEPEKPILIKEEAEWLDGLIKFEKSNNHSVYSTLYYITRQGHGYLFEYIDYDKDKKIILSNRIYPEELYPNDLKSRLIKAVLYGYEVEKEKLYIARNKTTGEHLYFNNAKKRFESGSLLTSYVKNIKAYHHTQDKLEKLNYWGNSLFEIEEV